MQAAPDDPFILRQPHTLQELGLSFSLVLELVLKHAYFEGTATLSRLAERSKLSPNIIHAVYRHLHKEQLCDTRAMIDNDYEISLNSRGRAAVEVAIRKSQYAGPAPVRLTDYRKTVSRQALKLDLTASRLRRHLNDLVISDEITKELGTALVTGGAILLYGSTGNGKTSIAERLPRLFTDRIRIPYAVEVAGEIVTVYDPLLHRSGDGEDAVEEEAEDPRWMSCHRPMVKVGGEMRVEMLDTQLDEVTRVCNAPLQMKANNGILLIDDFGRQGITPRQLLNRWIVPLDRRVDILSLWSGVSFEIPFEVLVVFATNLPLSDLAEDAFMRRLRNKIKIEGVSEELFRVIVRRVCEQTNMTCPPGMDDYMLRECLKRSGLLRACFPRDLLEILRGTAAFEQRTPYFGQADLDQAMKVYFAH